MRTGDGKHVVRLDDFAAERRWNLLITPPDRENRRASRAAEIQLRETAADGDALRHDPNRNRLAKSGQDRIHVLELGFFLRVTG